MTEETPTPPKRRPGRPRKDATQPAATTPEQADKPAEEAPEPKPKPAAKTPVGDPDPNIGRTVPAHWDECGMDNGHTYRCKGGFIVERVR